MKVALELQPCFGQRSGIGAYTHEITRRLQGDNEISYSGNVFDFLGRNHSAELYEEFPFPVRTCKVIPYGVYRRVWDYIPVNYHEIFPKSDINHFFNYIIPPNISGKVITTVFDMTYLRFPETMDSKNLSRLEKGIDYSVSRSDLIITISEFSKQEIIELLDIPEEKIKVIPLAPSIGSEQLPYEIVQEKYQLSDTPYLLYVGTIEPRKNLTRLIQAFDKVKKETGIPHKLVLAGGKGWNTDEILHAAKTAIYADDIIFTGYISSAEKNTLYQNATLFLFPSLYEGFGIPPLEAMHFGVPVICSSAASLPEVVGDCAELIDPLNIDEIATAIECLLSNDVRREELIEKGRSRATHFSWDESARQLVEVYNSLGG